MILDRGELSRSRASQVQVTHGILWMVRAGRAESTSISPRGRRSWLVFQQSYHCGWPNPSRWEIIFSGAQPRPRDRLGDRPERQLNSPLGLLVKLLSPYGYDDGGGAGRETTSSQPTALVVLPNRKPGAYADRAVFNDHQRIHRFTYDEHAANYDDPSPARRSRLLESAMLMGNHDCTATFLVDVSIDGGLAL